MGHDNAVIAFAALGHGTRLGIPRLLVQHGPGGRSAGAIAEAPHVVASTLSFHLKALRRPRLLTSRRRQRQIFYAADFAGLLRLLTCLTEDCGHGRPEICGSLMAAIASSDPGQEGVWQR